MTTPAAAPAPEAAPSATPPLMVPIGDIVPSPLNPRTHFDVAELTESVRMHGVLMPLLTRPRKGKHEIVEGERRYRAAKAAGVLLLEVKSRELSDADALEIMLLANGQREDLTPLEEAKGYKRLITKNPSKYSIAYIAQRISRSEKFVADRMRLLELIPELQSLLDAERILVGHAELLAKLKPEDQARAVDPGRSGRHDYRKAPGGLWTDVGATLDFDLDDEAKHEGADPYAGLKPVTVKELEAWIARHVRFDVEHAAKTAPLDFGSTAAAVELAEAQPGRGRKVIAITRDYRVQDDAKDGERVYGEASWRQADGRQDVKGKATKTCEHAVLGVFVVGPGQGTTLQVCVARDRCKTHFGPEIREREKNRKLRESGQGAKADAREKKAEESWEQRQARQKAERAVALAAYHAVHQPMLEALTAAVPTVLDRRVFDCVVDDVVAYGFKVPKDLAVEELPRVLVLGKAHEYRPDEWNADDRFEQLSKLLQHFGVDTAPFTKTFKAQLAEAKKAAAAKAARR